MKLKLESEKDITILAVTESIETMHIAVLKAGLKKLFAAGKSNIILDLTAISVLTIDKPEVAREIMGMPYWATEQGAQLQIISSSSKVQTVGSRAEAIENIKSPTAKLLQLESRLSAQIKVMEQQKTDLSQKVDSGSGANDLKAQRKLNTDLKKQVAMLESAIHKQLSKRTNSSEVGTLKIKQEHLRGLIQTVLEQEGSVPVKSQ